MVIDKSALARNIQQSLQQQSQVSLAELCQRRPLSQGLAELLAYLEIGDSASQSGSFQLLVDETQHDVISWAASDDDNNRDEHGIEIMRRARIPRIIYLRKQSGS